MSSSLSHGKRYNLIWEKMLLRKIGKPHQHDNMLNGKCMLFKDPSLGCMIDSDMRIQGRGKPCS